MIEQGYTPCGRAGTPREIARHINSGTCFNENCNGYQASLILDEHGQESIAIQPISKSNESEPVKLVSEDDDEWPTEL